MLRENNWTDIWKSKREVRGTSPARLPRRPVRPLVKRMGGSRLWRRARRKKLSVQDCTSLPYGNWWRSGPLRQVRPLEVLFSWISLPSLLFNEQNYRRKQFYFAQCPKRQGGDCQWFQSDPRTRFLNEKRKDFKNELFEHQEQKIFRNWKALQKTSATEYCNDQTQAHNFHTVLSRESEFRPEVYAFPGGNLSVTIAPMTKYRHRSKRSTVFDPLSLVQHIALGPNICHHNSSFNISDKKSNSRIKLNVKKLHGNFFHTFPTAKHRLGLKKPPLNINQLFSSWTKEKKEQKKTSNPPPPPKKCSKISTLKAQPIGMRRPEVKGFSIGTSKKGIIPWEATCQKRPIAEGQSNKVSLPCSEDRPWRGLSPLPGCPTFLLGYCHRKAVWKRTKYWFIPQKMFTNSIS